MAETKTKQTGIQHIAAIKPLTKVERDSIEVALREFIANHTEKRAWSQKIILEEMLYELMWAQVIR